MLAGSLLFVAGFAVVFVLLGFAAGTVGSWLVEWSDQLTFALAS